MAPGMVCLGTLKLLCPLWGMLAFSALSAAEKGGRCFLQASWIQRTLGSLRSSERGPGKVAEIQRLGRTFEASEVGVGPAKCPARALQTPSPGGIKAFAFLTSYELDEEEVLESEANEGNEPPADLPLTVRKADVRPLKEREPQAEKATEQDLEGELAREESLEEPLKGVVETQLTKEKSETGTSSREGLTSESSEENSQELVSVQQPHISKLQVKQTAESQISSSPNMKDCPTLEKLAVSGKFGGAAPEIQSIIKRGTLRVGMCTIDQPPFHVTGRNGEFVGFDIDLARKLAEALGVKLTFVKAPDWDSTIQLVVEGKADIMLSNMTLLPERATKVFCSRPYARIRQCILLNRILLTRAEGKGLTTLRQIFSEYDNRTLIIQKGAAYETSAATMFPKARIETTESWKEIMDKILSKEAFGTISDEIEIKTQMRSVQSMELTSVTIKDMFDLMVIGVSRDMPQLLHFINAFLEVENIECKLENF